MTCSLASPAQGTSFPCAGLLLSWQANTTCHQILGNLSVLQAAAKQSADEDAQRAFFEGNLERIPSGWRIARQKAEERGDIVRLVQDDVKLAAIDEVWQAFRELFEFVTNCVTRLRVDIKDLSLLDEAKINRLPNSGIVKKGNNVQIVIGVTVPDVRTRVCERLGMDY